MANINEFLEQCTNVIKPQQPNLDELKCASEKFSVEFPIETARCKILSEKYASSVLEENIASTYPLIHERVLILMCHFLHFKRAHGSEVEKCLYKNMTVIGLVDRLLKKRAVMFIGPADRYLLLTGEVGNSHWENIGTNTEKAPLLLENCLSYDELKLSAMLYVSGHTIFINDGNRQNVGIEDTSDNVQREGVITGLIGTRFEKHYVMEFQEIMLDAVQNTISNGYGPLQAESPLDTMFNLKVGGKNPKWLWRQLWSKFYDEQSLTFEDTMKMYTNQSNGSEITDKDKYTKRFVFDRNYLFDNTAYSKHLAVPFDCALLEASRRAECKGTTAYLHVVGLGLGVWKVFLHQNNVYVKTFLERIEKLCKQLGGLSDVHLSYIRVDQDIISSKGVFVACKDHPLGGIQVHLSNRQPSSKLTSEHKDKLLVETYAWDGNSQPGNEFWGGSLQGSGDPAAACSTEVAELHNSIINTRFACGENLHVAGKYGLKHVAEYARKMLAEGC